MGFVGCKKLIEIASFILLLFFFPIFRDNGCFCTNKSTLQTADISIIHKIVG